MLLSVKMLKTTSRAEFHRFPCEVKVPNKTSFFGFIPKLENFFELTCNSKDTANTAPDNKLQKRIKVSKVAAQADDVKNFTIMWVLEEHDRQNKRALFFKDEQKR